MTSSMPGAPLSGIFDMHQGWAPVREYGLEPHRRFVKAPGLLHGVHIDGRFENSVEFG